MRLNWPALLADVAETPVEPIQTQDMRVAPPRGQLAKTFSNAWQPDQHDLLMAVLAENRRYFRVWSRHESTCCNFARHRAVPNALKNSLGKPAARRMPKC